MSTKSNFDLATEWSIDRYYLSETRLFQCKMALLVSFVLNALLVLSVVILASNQTLVPLMVHHYENGVITVDKPKELESSPKDDSQIKSDIYRYITSRENYDISSYQYQFDEVSLLSSSEVGDEFEKEQYKQNPLSPINRLGISMSRHIHIYSINFIDRFVEEKGKKKKLHHNLAEVIFTAVEKDKQSSKESSKNYTALISWKYVQPSQNPKERWLNWNGFQVTRYSKEERSN